MDLTTGKVSNELVGGDVPKAVRAMIDAAKAAPSEVRGNMLWAAQTLDPAALPVYYLLYKFHASQGELEPAGRAARLGLAEAGRQAGLPAAVDEGPVHVPAGVNFQENGAARFWLFTLKALAFICARSGEQAQARRYLELLDQCDPRHSAGGEVTAALVAAAEPGAGS